jgi:hypothetical protein
MASFREYLISIQARESLAFWLETGRVTNSIIIYICPLVTLFSLIDIYFVIYRFLSASFFLHLLGL